MTWHSDQAGAQDNCGAGKSGRRQNGDDPLGYLALSAMAVLRLNTNYRRDLARDRTVQRGACADGCSKP